MSMDSHLQRQGQMVRASTLNTLFRLAFVILAISLFVGNLQVSAVDLIKPTVLTNTSYKTNYITKTTTGVKVETEITEFLKVFTVLPANANTPGDDKGPITPPPTITPAPEDRKTDPKPVKSPPLDAPKEPEKNDESDDGHVTSDPTVAPKDITPVVPSDNPSSPAPLDDSTNVVPPETPSSTTTTTTVEPTTKAPPEDSASVVPIDSPSPTTTTTTTPPSPTTTPPNTSPPITPRPKIGRLDFWASFSSEVSANLLSQRLRDAADGKITLTPEDIAAEALREEERRLDRIAEEERQAAAKALAEARGEQTWEEYIRGEDPFVSRDRRVAKAKAEADEKAAQQKKEAEEKAAIEKAEAERKAAQAKKEAEIRAAREKEEAEEKAAKAKKEAEEKAARKNKEAEEQAAREKAAAESSSSASSSSSVARDQSISSKSSAYAKSLAKKNALLSSLEAAASASRSSSSVSSASSASSYTVSSYSASLASVLGLPIAEASKSASSIHFQIPKETDPILKTQMQKALREFEYKQRAITSGRNARASQSAAAVAAQKAKEKAEQEQREKEEEEELENAINESIAKANQIIAERKAKAAQKAAEEAAQKALEEAEEAKRKMKEEEELQKAIVESVAKAAQIAAEMKEKAEREELAAHVLAADRDYFFKAVAKHEAEVAERIAKEDARRKARDDKMNALKEAYEEEQRKIVAKRQQEQYWEDIYRFLNDVVADCKSHPNVQLVLWVVKTPWTIILAVFNLLSTIISYPFYTISRILSAVVSFPINGISGLLSRFLQLFVDLYQSIPGIPSLGNYFNLPAWSFSWPSWSLGSLSWILELLSKAFGGKPYEGTAPGADIAMPSCGGSVVLTILAVASLFVVSITAHFIIQYVKSIAPGPFGVVSTILMYQPVFWASVFSLGYLIPFPFGWLINQLLFQWQYNRFFFFFVMLASFKAFKGFVHVFSYYFWTNPAQPPRIPSVTPRDVTVIVATVGDFGPDFQKTIQTILLNQPRQLIIATVGVNKAKAADNAIQDLPRALKGSTLVSVDMTMVPNKRSQFISAASNAEGSIVCYADDHVMWPTTFLRSALAPFEDAGVGMVGTVKAVERVRNKGLLVNFLNYIGCIYLERHNFECTATYNIDGGVFVISGRTGLIRKAILERLDFRTGFLNEYFNFGPLNSVLMKPDDDNFMTRYCVKNGWKTVFHNHPDACIGTSIGVDKDGSGSYLNKISGQLARWARTTWRSNLVSLFVDRVCWHQYPWTTYAMFISSFVNLAIIYDPLMLLLLHLSKPQASFVCGAVTLLALSKCVKPLGFIWKHPGDIYMLPFGILFGYFHSFIKLYALFTVTNVEWSGRVLTRPT